MLLMFCSLDVWYSFCSLVFFFPYQGVLFLTFARGLVPCFLSCVLFIPSRPEICFHAVASAEITTPVCFSPVLQLALLSPSSVYGLGSCFPSSALFMTLSLEMCPLDRDAAMIRAFVCPLECSWTIFSACLTSFCHCFPWFLAAGIVSFRAFLSRELAMFAPVSFFPHNIFNGSLLPQDFAADINPFSGTSFNN